MLEVIHDDDSVILHQVDPRLDMAPHSPGLDVVEHNVAIYPAVLVHRALNMSLGMNVLPSFVDPQEWVSSGDWVSRGQSFTIIGNCPVKIIHWILQPAAVLRPSFQEAVVKEVHRRTAQLVALVFAILEEVTFLFDGEAAPARQAAQEALVLAAHSWSTGAGANWARLAALGLVLTSVRVALRDEEEVIQSGPAVIGHSVTHLGNNLNKCYVTKIFRP